VISADPPDGTIPCFGYTMNILLLLSHLNSPSEFPELVIFRVSIAYILVLSSEN
jgi:hypothetical protein